MTKENSAVILLSGGQDSTTCLAWALEKFDHLEGLFIDYGQKHAIEQKSSEKIAKICDIPLTVHKTDMFTELTKNALTNHDQEIVHNEGELPTTFVPGRNMIFLSIASIFAQQKGISNIVTGVCQTDYSGYPDCRQKFIDSMAQTASLAMEENFKIHTPLMHLTKAETVEMIAKLGKIDLLKHSHTCYNGKRPACGKCPACELRLKGFEQAGITDPLTYE